MADIRRLGPADAAAYQRLRLEALERHPEAFAASLEDECQRTPDEVAERLATSAVFGAFEADGLAGVAGWYRMTRAKQAHRGVLWGVYVRPRSRGRELGTALVSAVLDDARGEVEQLHLSATATNQAALRLYERAGFHGYGTEPRTMKVNRIYHDDVLMVCRLDAPA